MDDIDLDEVIKRLEHQPKLRWALSNDDKAAVEGYYRLEYLERRHSAYAAAHHREPFLLWVRCLTLYYHGQLGDWTIVGDDATLDVRELQSRLLALSVSSAKAALDLLLAGYYSIAFAAIRHMMETVAQCIYVSLEPTKIHLWQPDLSLRTPQLEVMLQRIAKAGVISNVQVEESKAIANILNKGSHPTGIGLLQLESEEQADSFNNGPTYHQVLCVNGLNCGLNWLILLLTVLRGIRLQSESWKGELVQLILEYEDWRVRRRTMIVE